MALIAWAIDVPHMPLQRDAILQNGANPKTGHNYSWIVVEIRLMNKELLVIVNHHVTVKFISDGY